MTNTSQGPVNGGLPSLSLLPPWVSDEVETGQDAPLVCPPHFPKDGLYGNPDGQPLQVPSTIF